VPGGQAAQQWYPGHPRQLGEVLPGSQVRFRRQAAPDEADHLEPAGTRRPDGQFRRVETA